MSEKVSITKSKLDSLANAIASVGETSVPKTIAQMESAVLELTIPPNLQSKTITPSITQQIVSPDSGYDAFSQVTVNAIELQEKTVTPTTEQQIVTADSTTVIANTGDFSQSGTPTYNNPSTTGYYSFPMDLSAIETGKTYHVTGSGKYMAHNFQATINYTIDDDWVAGNDDIPLSINTLSVHLTWTSSGLKFTMPTAYSPGDRNIEFSGNISFAVSLDYDGLSKVTVNAMPSGTAGTPTATKGTVSNHSVSITPSVTNTTGYITGGTKNGTAVTVNVTELESGTKTITDNGTGISVSGYSAVDVAVQAGTIIDDGNGNINLSPTGEVTVITPLTVNQNGTYTAPSGTAYSPVTVNVSSGSDDKLIGLIERTLTSLSIPNGVTKIGRYAFANCFDLNITSIPNTVTSLDEYAFYGTSSTLTTIPSGISTIPAYCFSSCDMTSFTFPVGVTAINDYAFDSCTKLASVSLPNTITVIRTYAFRCSILTTLECAGAITTLGSYAFLGNTSFPSRLKTVSLPNMNLSALSTTFGYGTAASACQQLEFADIGNTKSISASAFANCYKLQTLILRRSDAICSLANVSAFTNTPMRGYNSLTGTVYVPNDLISTYQSATNWSTLYNNGTVTFAKIEDSAYDLS